MFSWYTDTGCQDGQNIIVAYCRQHTVQSK